MQWSLPNIGSVVNVFLYSDATGQTIGTPLTCPDQVNSCQVKFDGATYITTAGDYYLAINLNTAPAYPTDAIVIAQVIVTGSGSSRTTPILKQTNAVGPFRFHRVFFSTATTLDILLPFTDTDQRDYYQQAGFIRVFSEQTIPSSGKELYGTTTEINPTSTTGVIVSGQDIVKYSFPVAAKYSWIVIDRNINGGNTPLIPNDLSTVSYTWRINYPTEVYNCPFSPDYPDVTGIFRGCSSLTDLSRLPCVFYNTTIGACQACYTGYTLINGKCLENPCPAGQYKKYGQCIANPLKCDTYNDFSKCTKCSAGYTLNANGVCDRAPLNCTGRTFFNNATWTCDNVDAKCGEWNLSTGTCTSCLSLVEKAVNGKCIPLEDACPANQYINDKLECVDSDPLCSTFVKIGGKCITCVRGYEYNTNQTKCVKIVCPNRYVPNDFGRCARVSDLCQSYDARGVCLACIPTHALQADGVCLQIESPSPCPARQYLGDDNYCHEVSEFCEIYSRDTGMCSKCVANYFLMYTG